MPMFSTKPSLDSVGFRAVVLRVFAWDYYGCGHTSGEAVAWREDFDGEKA
jgi:hypothetical protein